MRLSDFPPGLTVATGSVRRQTQLLAVRPDFLIVPIRGNVPTRLQKLAAQPEMDATILAAAGLHRLGIKIVASGLLRGPGVPEVLAACVLEPELMLPCAGQGAVGLEIRQNDEPMRAICRRLDHYPTAQCVAAERSFLHAMGGGCQTPIGAYAAAAGTIPFARRGALDEKCPARRGPGRFARGGCPGRKGRRPTAGFLKYRACEPQRHSLCFK